MRNFLNSTAIVSVAYHLIPKLPAGTLHRVLSVGKIGKACNYGFVRVPVAANA
jgi:hypothetical protein